MVPVDPPYIGLSPIREVTLSSKYHFCHTGPGPTVCVPHQYHRFAVVPTPAAISLYQLSRSVNLVVYLPGL